MTTAVPSERVAEVLVKAGYRRIPSPLQIAGLSFDVAGAFVGSDYSADLVVIGDMAADGERKVVQQIDGIARALDLMRSNRPLTTVIVGPRPIGKALDSIAQVSRILAVEEAADPAELRDRLAVLLPLNLPTSSLIDCDLGIGEDLNLPADPFVAELVEASKLGELAVRRHFHNALNIILEPKDADDERISE